MRGFFERSYGKAQEDEAYDLGAAVQLPKGADPGASA